MPTLAQFAGNFVTQRAGTLKKGTLANYRGLLNKHIAPRSEAGALLPGCIGKLRLDNVSHQDVAALHQSLKETPRAANHMLDFLSSLYSEAQAAGLVADGFNPTRKIKRYAIQARQRFLNEQELAQLGEALAEAEKEGSENPYAIAAIRLLVFTGCRRDEILASRWEWIDFERGSLNLPDSKTGAKCVPMSPPALEVLRQLPHVAGNPYVIVGAKEGQRWVNLRKAWVRLRDRAGLEPIVLHNGKIQHVRLHDLRHTYASLLASGGASLPMIGKLLGHTQPITTARYAHLADDPVRRATTEAGKKIANVMKPK